jgi:hypothetical protein
MERKLYDDVEAWRYRSDGQPATKWGPAYARRNQWEYFAELSAAYLGQPTHALPFNRDELRKHDPAGYHLMERFWRSARSRAVNELSVPVAVDRLAESGRRFRLFDLWPGKEKEFDGWEGVALIATDLLDGTEYKFAKPEQEGRSWRVTPRPTGNNARAVAPPTPPPPR